MDPGWWGRLEGDDLNLGSAVEGDAQSSHQVKVIYVSAKTTIKSWKAQGMVHGETQALHIPFFPQRLQM